MKRLILLILVSYFAVTSYAAEKNLYKAFKDNRQIKVYLKEVTSEVKDRHIKVNAFKSVFEDVLKNRPNIKFVPVNSAGESDVIVTTKIKRYVFKEKVMPSFFSAAAVVADTTAPKSAAKLVVDYKIINPRDGKVLLTYKNFTTDERRPHKDMIDQRAFIHAADKNINRFIYRAFYKQRK